MRAYWKGDGGLIGEFAQPPHRLERPLRPQRPAAARQHQLRHRARRLHAARPGLLQRQAQRGQRRGQPRRRRRQPVVELRRRRRRPTIPTILRAARAPEAQLAGDAAASQGVPMLLAGDEIGRTPAAATTTPTARTTRSSWLDWNARRRRRRAARVRRAADRACAARTRCSAAATSSRAGRARQRRQGHRLAPARGAR